MSLNLLALIQQASSLLQARFPGVIVFTAVGRPASGVATQSDQLVLWQFRGNAPGRLDTVTIEYDAKTGFGPPQQSTPWEGADLVDLIRQVKKLSLDAAIGILNEAGFTQGFSSVSMGTPAAKDPQPMYWFCIDGQTQGVGVNTRQVFRDLFACE